MPTARPVVIRPFERRDRDQLTTLINLHVAAVIPGIALSVNAVLSQLEREPYESIVDPWVDERVCLVAERPDGIAAAALVHRFRADPDVNEGYRGTGDIRWLVCGIDALDAGAQLVTVVLDQMRAWRVTSVGAECGLPALACYGIPDTLPHLRGLLVDAGFGPPTRVETVLVARCADLLGHRFAGAIIARTLGRQGARLTLRRDGDDAGELGYVEVDERSPDGGRSTQAARWADVGNLVLRPGVDPAQAMPALLTAAAEWLLLGGITRLVDYWAADVDDPEYLEQLKRCGFAVLVRNERGFTRPVPAGRAPTG